MESTRSDTPSQSATPGAACLVDALLSECVRLDASDLHLASDLPPYFRQSGILLPQSDHAVLSDAQIEAFAVRLAERSGRSPLTGGGSLDGAVSADDGTRFRYNVYRSSGHIAIALRRLEDRFRDLKQLGLPDTLYRLCDLADGLVLVAGPTGSGKSTTLATLLNRINENRRCHMVTIEDPIEYLHKSRMALVHQRQVGSDTDCFYQAVVDSMRQDPDVILIGEIRDLPTIRTAITAAETGHLVFTTVHAGDCVGAIERLVSVFPADEQSGMRRQLSMVLRAIVTQHLVVADGRSAGGPSDGLQAPDQPDESRRRSRVVSSEILFSTPAVANLIATEKTSQIYSAMESGTSVGMQTLEQDLARLLVSGQISETTATAMARSPNILRERAQRLGIKNFGYETGNRTSGRNGETSVRSSR